LLTISMPASMYLMGEHAVMYSQPAILVTLGVAIKISINKCTHGCSIVSNYYGKLAVDSWQQLELVKLDHKLSLASQVVYYFIKNNNLSDKLAFNINIVSSIDPKYGLGSSGAMIAGVVASLMCMLI